MFGGSERVSLVAGVLTCRFELGREIVVELEHTRGDRERVVLPYPSAGVGGIELVTSPDERFAAMFMYSGQSEVGWELFELAPLRHIGRLPYVHGQGMAPLFSPDSAYLVMTMDTSRMVRGTEDWAEDILDPSADGEVVIDWATLFVQRLPEGPIQRVAIGTSVPRATDIDIVLEWNLYEPARFASVSALVIPLPWDAGFTVPFPPLVDTITTSAPRTP